MRRVLSHPLPWLAAFAVWFGTLWWLSSKVHHFPPAMDFQMSDKVMHFGYFLGGGILAAGFFQRSGLKLPARQVILLAVITAGLTGVLDEWHQSWVPGRSGNDMADLTADLLGALCGSWLMTMMQRWIAPKREAVDV